MQRKVFLHSLFVLLLLTCGTLLAQTGTGRTKQASTAAGNAIQANISSEGQACLNCHESTTPVLVSEWKDSEHFKSGIDCYSCHKASAGDPATFDHYGQKIAVIVTPKYCANCHAKEVDQYENSRHAKAAQFIGSLDNVLGEIVEGAPMVQSGCRQCHGSTVQYLDGGKFSTASWPNSGVGRVNPDGSLGSCAACHGRHNFSVAQAREPETCGKCHMGPDHPQMEIYNESMHGVIFKANHARMNLNSKSWIVGKDYTAAPACVTCHMGGTPENPEPTHDTGTRLSWTLRPAVSIHQANWEQKRTAMQAVCQNCHAVGLIENFYKQYDDTVNLYNTKFGEPAAAIMKKLTETKAISTTPFDTRIKWDYYEMWHHEGRAARMGSAMAGPDYTQWHGFYEVAKDFYMNFLPEAERLSPGITKEIQESPDNIWMKGLTTEQIQEQINYYKKRYNQ